MAIRSLSVSLVAFALCALTAMPAHAQPGSNYFNVEVDATCACDYQVTAWGWTTPKSPVHIEYSFTVTSNGIDYPVSFHLDATSDVWGFFSVHVNGLPLPGGCKNAVSFSNGIATRTVNGVTDQVRIELVSTPVCEPPPPSGKTFDIGPSSMEGHLLIRPGDWISGGYSFVFTTNHPDATVTVSSTLTVPFKCENGTTGEFVINLGTHDHFVPAGNKDWQPTGDANNVLSWAGSGQAPEGCGRPAMSWTTARERSSKRRFHRIPIPGRC